MGKIKGLVVGAGLAGAFRDDGNHANAIENHPNFELMGIVDRRLEARDNAKRVYQAELFENLEQALEKGPDFVALATLPEVREESLNLLLNSPSVHTVLSEKPFLDCDQKAKKWIQNFQKAGKRLYVNTHRRGNPTFQMLAERIGSQHYGRIQSASFNYMRGLWANVSHWMDLALLLFGVPESLYAEQSPVESPYPHDPNYTILMKYPDFHLHFTPLLSWDEGFYGGDLDITFDKFRLFLPNPTHYEQRHVKMWKANGRFLEEVEPDIYSHNMPNDFMGIYNLIAEDIRQDIDPSIPQEDIVFNIALLKAVEKSAKEGRSILKEEIENDQRVSRSQNRGHHSSKDVLDSFA